MWRRRASWSSPYSLAAEAALVCHPDTPGPAVQSFRVGIERSADGLTLSYSITGEVHKLRIPAPRAARVAGQLWQHTCCEMFVARDGEAAYHEFNFSPSGEWAAFAFTGYRAGAVACGAGFAPGIAVEQTRSSLRLRCRVRFAAEGKLKLALCAVIEALDGKLSYWALRHRPGKPDFHHREAFALELDEVRH